MKNYSSGESRKELRERFTFHPPHGDQVDRYKELRETAHALAVAIDQHCPPSREKSLAQTHLQQVVQMANASIAIHESKPGGDS